MIQRHVQPFENRLVIVRVVIVAAGIHLAGAGWAEAAVDFNREIRPILSEKCFSCHGFDEKSRKGKRRLDTFAGATADRDGFRAITPGDPSTSELWIRITSEDEEERMPPKESNKEISPREKALLRQWITEGAEYQMHWAYEPPRNHALPVLRDAAWPRNGIDHFILQKLEAMGVKPSPEADRAVLVRRLSLDLTGLPPTPAEVAAFVSDHSPNAYEQLVDRLLASPHYGERMAVDWLDAARYADTNGYQIDRDRDMWAWRDWVIDAFNRNLPFDQFTIEQIAGDLLPNATLAQRIATGFNRNHMINEEGGIIPEEFLAEYAADRVETTAAVWLGQTVGCARCHDHKFDPISQRDFYSLKAFFHNVPELGRSLRESDFRQASPPYVKLPSVELDTKLTALRAELSAAEKERDALRQQEQPGMDDWAQRLTRETPPWTLLKPEAADAGEQKTIVSDTGRYVQFGSLGNRRQEVQFRIQPSGSRVRALRLICSAVDRPATFTLSGVVIEQGANDGEVPRRIRLRPAAHADSLSLDDTAKIIDGLPDTRVDLALKPGVSVSIVFEIPSDSGARYEEDVGVTFRLESHGARGATRWTVAVADCDPAVLAPADVLAAAVRNESARTAADRSALMARFAAIHSTGRQVEDRIHDVRRRMAQIHDSYSTTLVMEEMNEKRDTFVLLRGAYDKPGEQVGPATPAVLPSMAPDLPRNRLGLARWLVSRENPLTARVTANRLWQSVFGAGLVRTSEDFGSQGEPPSHPELLDWLANEFVRTGWDVKAFVRTLVTSATYRQQSRFTPSLLELDAENRWLGRGPRFRLMGEFVRDQALAASGLLVRTIGGPSVRPYHPPGLYEGVAPTSEDTVKTYIQSKGPGLHRRSLYTYWKRSVPHPAMLAFDVPFRETCTIKRTRSNTPLQALNLMNDPTYVEAARFLSQRMIKEGGAQDDSRLKLGFQVLLARDPKPAELVVLRRALQRARADFAADPAAAAAFLAVGENPPDPSIAPAELAAFAAVAGTLLCLDETVTKQ